MKSIWFDAAARITNYRSGLPVIGKSYHCCGAIRRAVRTNGYKKFRKEEDAAIKAFAKQFKPRNRAFEIPWWSDPSDTDADQEARRLALCFMHWIEQRP